MGKPNMEAIRQELWNAWIREVHAEAHSIDVDVMDLIPLLMEAHECGIAAHDALAWCAENDDTGMLRSVLATPEAPEERVDG